MLRTAYIPFKNLRKHWRQTSISLFLLKQLQNFGEIVNQQLHLYKNTFGFSVRATKVTQLTLKTSFITPDSFFFGSWGENIIPESVFGMFYVHTFQWHLQLKARLSSVFWLSFTKRSIAPRHLAPINTFRPHGSEVSSSSFSFCLAAGRANLWASCSFIHKLLILFYHCAKINNHSYLTLKCLKSCINTIPTVFIHIQSNRST